jgi:nucleoside-diphosphate-sugar epimerase
MALPVLVTGGTGFVGRHLFPELQTRGVLAVTDRRELSPHTHWRDLVNGKRAVIHLAAAAHERAERLDYESLHRINALATERLAREAAAAGAGHFVFLSTIGVCGDETAGAPFNDERAPAPRSAYARSKLEAERLLAKVSTDTGLRVTVLRPTLVYGPGNAGNFLRLLKAVKRGLPLPFGRVRNRRTLTYVGNLVSAIVEVLERRSAGTFVVCDSESLSTAAIVQAVAQGMGRPARLVPVPETLLRLAGIANRNAARRLVGSLEAESRKLRALGWQAPYRAQDALALTGEWFGKS